MAQQTIGTVVLAWKTSGSKSAAKNARDIERQIGKTGLAATKTQSPFARMSTGIDSINKRTGSLVKGTKALVAAFVGLRVVREVGGSLKEAAHNALEDENASRRLAIALHNTTGATAAQTAGVEDWISKQGLALGFSDDKLRPALQRLAQSTHDIGKAQQLTSLAMNVAAGSGKDLETVSAALAKAQNGNMGALSKLGIRIKDVHGKTMSLDAVTKDMAKTFNGQASAAAENAQGRFARLGIQWDEMKEQLGYHLLPALSRLGGYLLRKVIPAVQQWSTDFDNFQGSAGKLHTNLVNIRIDLQRLTAWLKRNKDALITAAQASLSLYTAFKLVSLAISIGTAVSKVYNATMFASKVLIDGYRLQLRLAAMEGKSLTVVQKLMTIGQVALNAAWAANPVGIIVLGVTALVGAFVLAYMKVDWFRNGVNKAFGFIKDVVTHPVESLKSAWGSISGFFGKVFHKVVQVAKRIFARLRDAVSTPFKAIVSTVKAAINVLIAHINQVIDGINVITSKGSKLWTWTGLPSVPSIPHVPALATGARVETSGRIVRVADAGRPENVFSDAQLGNLMGYAAARMQTTSTDMAVAALPEIQAARAARSETIQLVTPSGQVLMEWLLDAAGARLARA